MNRLNDDNPCQIQPVRGCAAGQEDGMLVILAPGETMNFNLMLSVNED